MFAQEIDFADGWNPGRFYFGLDVAKSQCELWLKKRERFIEGSVWKELD